MIALALPAAAATLEFNDGDTETGPISQSGINTFIAREGVSATMAGVISGTGTVSKIGAGALTITGDNTYSGGTDLAGGYLRLMHNNALGTGAVAFNGGGLGFYGPTARSVANDMVFNNVAVLDTWQQTTLSGVLSGAALFKKFGNGTLTLSGGNTFTGGLLVQAGTVRAENSHALGSGTITFDGGGSLAIYTSTAMSVANNMVFDGNATLDTAQHTTISGTLSGSGSLTKVGGGTLTLSGDNNTFSGDLFVRNGIVLAESDHALGSGTVTFGGESGRLLALSYADGVTIRNNVAVNANTSFHVASGTATQAGRIEQGSGRVYLNKSGLGELVVTGAINAGFEFSIYQGQLTAAAENVLGNRAYHVENAGTLKLRADQQISHLSGGGKVDLGSSKLTLGTEGGVVSFGGSLVGGDDAHLVKTGGSVLTLDGSGLDYYGRVSVQEGTLAVNGNFAGTPVLVTGGRLQGAGQLGDVVVDGGTLTGTGGTTLSMRDLRLTGSSIVEANLGTVNNAALFNVAGDLVLDGTLNVNNAGGFGPGIYRLFSYGGALDNRGLEIGTTPKGYSAENLAVQTSIGGQVNLVAANPNYGPVLFWDGDNAANWDNGKIDGGNGRWRTGGRAFTDAEGLLNGPMNPRPGFVVFGGTAGNVVVDSGTGQVQATGMQFATSGYTLSGDMLDLVAGDAFIRVGDGTAAGANYIATISNHMDGAGHLIKTDLGTLILEGDNTYWGGTEIREGTLQIGNGGTWGSIVGDVVNNSVLAFNRSDAVSFDGTISGSGVVNILGGNVTFTADNSYSGGTAIANGASLSLGNGGTTGWIVGDVVNNGTLAFNRSDDRTFAGAITGTGATRFLSGGVTLTADSSYTGGTTIANGALVSLGNGGKTGSVVGDVANDGSLIISRSNDLTLAGVISGSGSLRQSGSGKTELTGDSGGFTGMTSVENGILAVNGTLGGTMNVWETGRLQGTGTVGDTTVSGTIAPGNSIGTLNVAGNITFNAGSIYEVEVNAAGQGDGINATGTATITGGSVKVVAGMGNYAPATTYTILTADGGRAGTFTEGVTSNLAFLDPSLSYDANNVYLTMTRNSVSFQNVGVTRNQTATAGGLESLGFGNAVYNAVLNLSAPQARAAFDQLSGELHASVRSAMVEDSRFIRNAVNDRIRAAFDSVGAANGTVVTYENGALRSVAATTDRLAFWTQGFGSWGYTDGNGNAARLNRSTGGFFIGADAAVFDTWRFGAVAGYSNTGFDVKGRHSSGSSDNYHIGLYGGTTWGAVAFRSGAAYTWHDISTSRVMSFPGFSDSLKGRYDAGTAQVFGELGYGINAGAARFEPVANLAYVSVRTDGFSEKGGAAALISQGATTDATFTTLGLRASTSLDVNGATLTARGMVGWRHAFGDVTPLSTMRFAGGGDAFTIASVPITREAAVIEAGLDFALTPAATLGVIYGGQFGSSMSDQSVKANFNVKF